MLFKKEREEIEWYNWFEWNLGNAIVEYVNVVDRSVRTRKKVVERYWNYNMFEQNLSSAIFEYINQVDGSLIDEMFERDKERDRKRKEDEKGKEGKYLLVWICGLGISNLAKYIIMREKSILGWFGNQIIIVCIVFF